MKTLHAQASRTIAAPPEAIYAMLRDYRESHPRLLPTRYFKGLTVLEGGHGAGTRFKTAVTVMGQTREYDMDVTEPRPLTLVETDRPTGLRTSFGVERVAEGARLTISTEWSQTPGLQGWLEALTAPSMMKKIYEEELTLIEQAARELQGQSAVRSTE